MVAKNHSTFSEKFERIFHNVLPSPFTLAVGLTFFVFISAVLFFKPAEIGFVPHTLDVITYWHQGIWNGPLLVFAYQMMLILVLGHVLALTKPAEWLIGQATVYCTSNARAAAIITFTCITLGFLNWGLALIFGAIFARKIAEHAQQKGIKINYPLIGAAGYTGLMVWHGGLSGSSLIKAAEPGHIKTLTQDNPAIEASLLPDLVGFSETVFSTMNISVWIALIVILPFSAYAIGKYTIGSPIYLKKMPAYKKPESMNGWAERFDHYVFPAYFLGLLCLLSAIVITINSLTNGNGQFVNPNYLNLIFLGLGLILHGSLSRFAWSVKQAISGAAGILIQFPLYFGILGIMQNAGIVTEISAFFVSISNPYTYPLFTFISAGIVNIMVPSGGGQWMIQGPIIIESSQNMGVPLGKNIMAMAYGDEITNMLQPFWALPLLAITGLKAKDILPYTLYFMMIGGLIYLMALIFF